MAIPDKPVHWLHFDITKFEYNVEEKIPESLTPYTGQVQRTPHLINETDLLKLRKLHWKLFQTFHWKSANMIIVWNTSSKIIRNCSQNI